MKKPIRTFSGSLVALVTPFDAQGNVDYGTLDKLIDFHLENGTDGIVALGTTAETPTLSDEEKTGIAKRVIGRVAGRVPVIVGAGSNHTAHAAALARHYEELGADGLLVVTPYYNKANKSGMRAHFETVAAATGLPIILYNVPGRTGCSISIDVLTELSRVPNITGIKEASGDISYVAQCARLVGDGFCLLSGNDDSVVPLMALGGSGVISVLANVAPRQTHDMAQAFLDGDAARARQLQLALLPLINALFIETNPVPVKAAVNLLGFSAGGCRLPLGPMADSNLQTLKQCMEILR